MTSRTGTSKLKQFGLSALGILVLSAAFGIGNPRIVGASSPTPQVIVANTSSQPVPTQAQGTTAIQGTVDLAAGTSVKVGNVVLVRPAYTAPVLPWHEYMFTGPYLTYTVPTGYQLVIENISGWTYDEPDAEMWAQVLVNGATRQTLVFTKQGTGSNGTRYVTNHAGRVYLDPGDILELEMSGIGSQFFLEGYLVPAP